MSPVMVPISGAGSDDSESESMGSRVYHQSTIRVYTRRSFHQEMKMLCATNGSLVVVMVISSKEDF